MWIGDPLPGATHDAEAIAAAGVLQRRPDLPETSASRTVPDTGDKGYVGVGTPTPAKKPPKDELREDQKESNRAINRVRAVVEQAIADVKTRPVLLTDCLRPHETFVDTTSAVTGLQSTAHQRPDEQAS